MCSTPGITSNTAANKHIFSILTPKNKDRKVTYSKSPLELCNKTKYVIELISVKSHRKCHVFLVAKTVKDITNHLSKLAKLHSG